MAQYFSPRALESQRSSGFKSTSNAIAEIVDNAFDAEASEVTIIFIERKSETSGQFSVDEILIADNGKGMTNSKLESCLTFGSSENISEKDRVKNKKLGKFGYGLPNSSLSQCPLTTVYSWTEKNKVFKTDLDLERIIESDSIEIPNPKKTKLPTYFSNFGKFSKLKCGTIIQWENCDRLKPKRAKTLIEHSERMLGRTFRYMISNGKVIKFMHFQENEETDSYTSMMNPRHAVANDPLYLTPVCTLAPIIFEAAKTETPVEVRKKLKLFVKSKTECKATNIPVPAHTFKTKFQWKDQIYHYEIKSSIAHIDIQKPNIREGGRTEVGKHYRKKLNVGSISFVRADREIDAGRFGIYEAGDPTDRWWTIEVKFDSDLDDIIGVSNNKQYIEFEKTWKDGSLEAYDAHTASLSEARDELWIQLSKILENARKALKKEIRANDKRWKQKTNGGGGGSPGLPSSTPTTQNATSKTDGKGKQLTEEQKKALLAILTDKYPKLDKKRILLAIDNFDQLKSKGILLYAESDADKLLWTFTPVNDFLVILVNTSHKFYENVMEPLKDADDDSALSSLELFISSLAWSEYDIDDEQKQNVLEDFRESSGQHLSRYIRDNKIKITSSGIQSLDET